MKTQAKHAVTFWDKVQGYQLAESQGFVCLWGPKTEWEGVMEHSCFQLQALGGSKVAFLCCTLTLSKTKERTDGAGVGHFPSSLTLASSHSQNHTVSHYSTWNLRPYPGAVKGNDYGSEQIESGRGN